MVREKLKSTLTSFTADGDFLAVLSTNGVVKIWSTSTGSLLAEWKRADGDSNARISGMACTFIGKKRTKERGTCLVAIGTEDGDVLAVNVFTGEVRWKSTVCQSGGITGLFFANKGRRLYTVGSNGMASEIKSETGEVVKEFKVSKKPVSSSACSCDEKIVAATSAGIWIYSIEDEEELLKFSNDLGLVQYISMSDDAKVVITSGFGEKELQVWKCELSTNSVTKESVLAMRNPPVAIECKNGFNEEDSSIILSVSESGVAYIWNLKTSVEEINPTMITVKAKKVDMVDTHSSGKSKKGRTSIIAARLHDLEEDGKVKVLIAYGSIDSLEFSLVDINKHGEDIVIVAGYETLKTVSTVQENVIHAEKGLEEVATPVQTKKASKKRAASDSDSANAGTLIDNGHTEPMDGVKVDDLTEPTMGEKLASLNLVDDNETKRIDSSLELKPPSADSVHVLLKQALHADDQALLLDCLFRKDDKVVTNSVSVLNPSDVLKLLEHLISLIQSRGAVLACVLPWLRSLLLQHASGIMSQESSLLELNSLYQLIESRNSTFNVSIQLSSCLDLLYVGTVSDEVDDENEAIQPVIYEDDDESDEDGSEEEEDAMETDEEMDNLETFSDDSDLEGSGMCED